MTAGTRTRTRWRLAARVRDERGTTLIELLVVSTMMIVVLSAVLAVLEAGTRAENRDRQFALAIQDGQSSLMKMVHEIRQAYNVIAATPSSIDFDVVQNGVQLHAGYFCNVAQTGTSYSECVRVQAASVTAALPAPSGGALVILRVQNGTTATYCNADGTYSNSVFHFANDLNRNNGGTCSETGEQAAAAAPTFIQAAVNLPASGELAAAQSAGVSHTIALTAGGYIRNLNALGG